MSRTILIVGIDYWPDVTGIAPYTTQFAEYLAEQGDDVHVITGMPYYPEWAIKHGYARRLRKTETINGVTLHRRRQYVPRKQSALRRAGYEGTFLVNAAIGVRVPKPDVVIGVIPSLSSGVLAARVARRHGAPLSLWVQDLMGRAASQSGMAGGGSVARRTASIEGWVARQAGTIGIITEGFRPYLLQHGVSEETIHVIGNWSHIERSAFGKKEARSMLSMLDGGAICMHTGNMGLKQGLDTLIEAARCSWKRDDNLSYVLLGDGSQRSYLESLASDLPNVRFIDPVPSADYPTYLAAADVLILTQRGSVVDMSLPSKLTSYVAAGRPVVAAVSHDSEAARFVRRLPHGHLALPDDAESLADVCRRVIGHDATAGDEVKLPESLAKEQALINARMVLCGG